MDCALQCLRLYARARLTVKVDHAAVIIEGDQTRLKRDRRAAHYGTCHIPAAWRPASVVYNPDPALL